MARKTNKGKTTVSNKVSITYVKKAGMWCKTWFEGFTQKQAWSMDKPSE